MSQPLDGSTTSSKPRSKTETPSTSDKTKGSASSSQPQTSSNFQIRRTFDARGTPPPAGTVIQRRTTPQVLQRSRPPAPAGSVLQRKGSPRDSPNTRSGPNTGSRGPPRPGGRGPRADRIPGVSDLRSGSRGGAGGFRPRGGSTGNPEDDAILDAISSERATAAAEARQSQQDFRADAYEEYQADQYNADRNYGLPTVPIPYAPAEQSIEELRKDWPDTAATATGMAEGVLQKLNFLARALPHDYWTPRQIAERLVQGGLVKFEDEEHKAKVLSYVPDVLKVKTSHVRLETVEGQEERSDEKRQAFAAWAAEFPNEVTTVTEAKDKGGLDRLMDVAVKGTYPALGDVKGAYGKEQKHVQRLLGDVARQLGNNGSYNPGDSAKVLGRVRELIVQDQGRAKALASARAAEQ